MFYCSLSLQTSTNGSFGRIGSKLRFFMIEGNARACYAHATRTICNPLGPFSGKLPLWYRGPVPRSQKACCP